MIIKVTKTIYTKWKYYAMDITGIFYECDICNNGMFFSLILLHLMHSMMITINYNVAPMCPKCYLKTTNYYTKQHSCSQKL